MGEKTNISWTHHTYNAVWGCTRVSPGCDNCYAADLDARWGGSHWGKKVPRREFGDAHSREPLKWEGEAANANEPRYVFCGSMCDVMDDEWPDGTRERLWTLIDATPHLTWQLLTKRPHRYERYLPANGFSHGNVWLGTSTENQQFYDVRWPILRRVALALSLVSFISYEPALGPISILTGRSDASASDYPNWMIAGSESGPKRRPAETQWYEKLRDECSALGVSFFMKQLGARTPEQGAALIPASLLIRQFPSLGDNNGKTEAYGEFARFS